MDEKSHYGIQGAYCNPAETGGDGLPEQLFQLRQKLGQKAKQVTACACFRRELSGEPDAGNLPVRFDEGRMSRASASLTLLLYRLSRLTSLTFTSHTPIKNGARGKCPSRR